MKELLESIEQEVFENQDESPMMVLAEDLKLTPSHKKVIDAFLNQKRADNKKFYTDGVKLDGLWIGGNKLAEWYAGKVYFGVHAPMGRAHQTVMRYIKKKLPKSQLEWIHGDRGGVAVRFENMQDSSRKWILGLFETAKEQASLVNVAPESDFAIPERRAWPIQNAKQAKVAIDFINSGRGKEGDYPRIIEAIQRKYGTNESVIRYLKRLLGDKIWYEEKDNGNVVVNLTLGRIDNRSARYIGLRNTFVNEDIERDVMLSDMPYDNGSDDSEKMNELLDGIEKRCKKGRKKPRKPLRDGKMSGRRKRDGRGEGFGANRNKESIDGDISSLLDEASGKGMTSSEFYKKYVSAINKLKKGSVHVSGESRDREGIIHSNVVLAFYPYTDDEMLNRKGDRRLTMFISGFSKDKNEAVNKVSFVQGDPKYNSFKKKMTAKPETVLKHCIKVTKQYIEQEIKESMDLRSNLYESKGMTSTEFKEKLMAMVKSKLGHGFLVCDNKNELIRPPHFDRILCRFYNVHTEKQLRSVDADNNVFVFEIEGFKIPEDKPSDKVFLVTTRGTGYFENGKYSRFKVRKKTGKPEVILKYAFDNIKRFSEIKPRLEH